MTPAKTISNYAQVVKMVVASAIGDNGDKLYPRKWNHEFIDLPDVAGQRTPTFTAQEVEKILAAAEGQMRMPRHATGSNRPENWRSTRAVLPRLCAIAFCCADSERGFSWQFLSATDSS